MSTKTLVEAMVREVRVRLSSIEATEVTRELLENLEARVRAFMNEQDAWKKEMLEIIEQQGPFDQDWCEDGRRKDLRDALSVARLKLNHALVSFSPNRDDVAKWEWIVRELTYLLHK